MVGGPHRRPPLLFLGQLGPGGTWPLTPLPSHPLGSLEEPPTAVWGAEGAWRVPCCHPRGWGPFMYLCPKGELGGWEKGGREKEEVSWVEGAHCLPEQLLPMVVSPELCPGAGGGEELTSLPCTSEPLPCSHTSQGGGDSAPARAQQPSLPPLPPPWEGKSWAWAVPCGALVVSVPWLRWPGG